MEIKSLEMVKQYSDQFTINWKFYAADNILHSKEYTYQHFDEILHGDCHSVFRTNQDGIIDWVGYTSDDIDDRRRNMLIEHPSYILKKVLPNSTVYITMGGRKVFRYLTVRRKYDIPPFYEIIDYEISD